MEDSTTPMIQILAVENGYIITAYHGKEADSPFEIMGALNKGMAEGNIMDAFQKMANSQKLRESTRRKSVEHHIAKSEEELFRILKEVLSTLKG